MQIMDLLGQSLWDVWNAAGQVMTDQYVACIAVEAIVILEHLHKKGCVTGGQYPKTLKLTDPRSYLHSKLATQSRASPTSVLRRTCLWV